MAGNQKEKALKNRGKIYDALAERHEPTLVKDIARAAGLDSNRVVSLLPKIEGATCISGSGVQGMWLLATKEGGNPYTSAG